MSLTAQSVIDFLKNSLNVDGWIDASTRLFSTGLLDSVAMMNLIGFVESTTRIEVHPADVTLDNFDSVDRIVQFANAQQ